MRLVLDPGHGGADPGASALDSNADVVREKDVTLYYVKRLMETLWPESGATRFSDIDLTLDQRCEFANNARPKVMPKYFVSIHCNSCPVPNSAYGMEVFHFPGSKEGERIANIVNDYWLWEFGQGSTRGVKMKGYKVLRETKMPAILIELGFMNNTKNLAELTNIFWSRRVNAVLFNSLRAF